MRKFLILSLTLAVSLSFGCADREQRSEAAGEPAMTDNQLEERVEAQLKTNADVDRADISVDADAERNMVTLSGDVETEGLRNQAIELARNAHPGLMVNSEIEVEPREISRSEYTEEHARSARERATKYGDKIGASLDDAWIHTKITTQLIGDRDTSATEINVDVNNNVVTLRGTVDSAEEKAEATRIAQQTEGVKSVNNQLKVSTSERR
jgi:hyperosmotically inducible periplasmic protein